MKKIIVHATSFLDKSLDNSLVDTSKNLLDSIKDYKIEYRCDRDPNKPIEESELKDAVIIIADLEKYDKKILSNIGEKGRGSVKLIARYGIGTDNIDLKSAKKYGIMVTNCPGSNSIPTAEWTIATIMDVAGNKINFHQGSKTGLGYKNYNRLDINGKNLGIIGTGQVGKEVIKMMQSFNVKTFAYSPHPDLVFAKDYSVNYVDSPDEVYNNSDIISIHANTKNKKIISAKELKLMKKTAILINCARSHLVDNKSVHQAISRKELFGYGLDSPWSSDLPPIDNHNIVVSPHVGSDTDYGKMMMRKMSVESVIEFTGQSLNKNIVV